jgi:predicted dehydrogenase
MKQIKVAVIGAGFMASEHIKAFAAIEEVALVGIHSRTRSRAEALALQYGIAGVFDSVDALHAGTQADLLIVSVPELQVREVCLQVFKHPWVALIEKPAGYDLADAEAIAAAARQSARRAYVALNRRHYSSTRAVAEQLAEIEGPRLVNVFDQENPTVALDGGQPPLVVENWMYANAIHIIDYLRVFCRGEVTSVEHIVKWNPSEPRFVVTKITFASGDIGMYQAVWNAPGPWFVAVNTQAKRWEMRPLEQATVQPYKSRRSEPIPAHAWDTEFKAGLRLQAEEAVKAVRGEVNQLPTLEDGISTMKLVKQIYEA